MKSVVYLFTVTYLLTLIVGTTRTFSFLGHDISIVNDIGRYNNSQNNAMSQIKKMQSLSGQLHKFCLYSNISLTFCSCKKLSQLCQVEEFIKKVEENITLAPKYTRRNKLSIIYASITVVASVFGIFGNGFVLLVAYMQRRELPECKFHIAILAAINFIFSCVQVVNTTPLFWTNQWIYSRIMCKFVRSFIEIGSLLTTGFIFIIAVERYMMIVHPLRSKFSKRKFKPTVLIFTDIVLAIATIIPYFTGLDIEQHSGRCVMFAGEKRKLSLPYNMFVIIVYSVLPVGVILLLNVKMLIYISKKETNQVVRKGEVYLRRLKSNRRIINISLSVLIAFIFCTLPTRSFMIYLEIVDFRVKNMEVYFALAFIAYVTYPLQCTLNPVLYSMIAKEWRKEMRLLWLSSTSGDSQKNVRGNSLSSEKASRHSSDLSLRKMLCTKVIYDDTGV